MNEKEQELIDLLSQSSTVLSVKNIAQKLYMSEPTVRRYLSALSNRGVVVRTHGGAMINYNATHNKSVPLYLRIATMSEQKSLIAKQAVNLISDGNVIFLDASSSAFHLVPHLKNFHDLTVLTNSLKTAITLSEMNIKTICLGGDVATYNLSCGGMETIEMIKNFNADILFFSCDALSNDGVLSDNSRESGYLRKQLMKNAKIKVLLVDSTKLGKSCWHTLCSIEDVDYCFCDIELPSIIADKIKKINH